MAKRTLADVQRELLHAEGAAVEQLAAELRSMTNAPGHKDVSTAEVEAHRVALEHFETGNQT